MVYEPRLGVLAIIFGSLGCVAIVRRGLVWWDLLIFGLAGALIIDYGFANVGLSPGVPIPLATLLLGLIVVGAAFGRFLFVPRSLPFLLAIAFVFLASLRLAVDLPIWGRAALRDFTLPLELGFLFAGYWAVQRYGVERFVNSLRWVFVGALGYFALYPWRAELAAEGPVVGLQHSVPLLGNYWGAGTAGAAALFFFALVRPFGRVSYLIAASFLPVLLLVQARGIYIAVPAVSVFVLVAGLRAPGRVGRGLATTAAVGVIGLALVLAHGPEGRLGQVTPQFLTAHLATLWGRDGPSAGSVEHRKQWVSSVLKEVREQRLGWATGLGLGPDLTSGFEGKSGTLVRKPHNDYLEIFARLGLPALLLFCGVLVTAWVRVLRAARRLPSAEAGFLWWVVATAALYMLIAATQPLLFYSYGTMPLFVALGAGLALVDRAARGTTTGGQP
jgi:O-antigen ligase